MNDLLDFFGGFWNVKMSKGRLWLEILKFTGFEFVSSPSPTLTSFFPFPPSLVMLPSFVLVSLLPLSLLMSLPITLRRRSTAIIWAWPWRSRIRIRPMSLTLVFWKSLHTHCNFFHLVLHYLLNYCRKALFVDCCRARRGNNWLSFNLFIFLMGNFKKFWINWSLESHVLIV